MILFDDAVISGGRSPEAAQIPGAASKSAKEKKTRLDERLAASGFADTAKLAQSLVMRGVVLVNGKPVASPAFPVSSRDVVSFKSGYAPFPWVSRGGVKLAFALEAFGMNPQGMICADIGASTGGFTDVLLTRGAAKVYAVDVGLNELAWKLRCDPRVKVLDGVNARTMPPETLPEAPDLVVCDVSFISVKLALNAAVDRLKPGGVLMTLIKPQFECPFGSTEGGVVRDAAARARACLEVCDWAVSAGLVPSAMCKSPVTGRKGNVEYFLHAEKHKS